MAPDESGQHESALAACTPRRTGANSGLTSPMRIYDALLGGKENYDANRQAARRLCPGAASGPVPEMPL
jgi:S-adenosyl methyltransferase